MDSVQSESKKKREREFLWNLQVVFSSIYKMNHTRVLMKMLLNYYDFINKTSVAI